MDSTANVEVGWTKGFMTLPMDILITICEFLAGDLAFGTIASVNVANRAVHTDTLSILYETVLFDELSRIYGEDGYPSSLLEEVLKGGAFRSTKFIFCSRDYPFRKLIHRADGLSQFPKLAMTLEPKWRGWGLCLRKPLSVATVFTKILSTAMVQYLTGTRPVPTSDAAEARAQFAMSWLQMSFEDGGEMVGEFPANMDLSCWEQADMALCLSPRTELQTVFSITNGLATYAEAYGASRKLSIELVNGDQRDSTGWRVNHACRNSHYGSEFSAKFTLQECEDFVQKLAEFAYSYPEAFPNERTVTIGLHNVISRPGEVDNTLGSLNSWPRKLQIERRVHEEVRYFLEELGVATCDMNGDTILVLRAPTAGAPIDPATRPKFRFTDF